MMRTDMLQCAQVHSSWTPLMLNQVTFLNLWIILHMENYGLRLVRGVKLALIIDKLMNKLLSVQCVFPVGLKDAANCALLVSIPVSTHFSTDMFVKSCPGIHAWLFCLGKNKGSTCIQPFRTNHANTEFPKSTFRSSTVRSGNETTDKPVVSFLFLQLVRGTIAASARRVSLLFWRKPTDSPRRRSSLRSSASTLCLKNQRASVRNSDSGRRSAERKSSRPRSTCSPRCSLLTLPLWFQKLQEEVWWK